MKRKHHVMTIAERVVAFNRQLHYAGKLPSGYQVLNPYIERPETDRVMKAFYEKYYNDSRPRKFLIGINPSRHGAGVTGVPFTDTKRLEQVCGIPIPGAHTHEISSVFMYDMIDAYGGPADFYRDFYINSPFPLAIIRRTESGSWRNANYYDDKALFGDVKSYMIEMLKAHIALGLDTNTVYVLGKKNAQYLRQINSEERLFGHLEVLEHPRYIQQYRSKDKPMYIANYVRVLRGA